MNHIYDEDTKMIIKLLSRYSIFKSHRQYDDFYQELSLKAWLLTSKCPTLAPAQRYTALHHHLIDCFRKERTYNALNTPMEALEWGGATSSWRIIIFFVLS